MYTLFQCTNTKSLCTESIEEGFATWVPLIKRSRKCPKTGEITKTTVAAISGYIFVPYEEWTDYARWGMKHGKGVRLCTVGEDEFRRPVRITLEELQVLDTACKELGSTALNRPAPYRVGDKVKIIYGALEGYEGSVSEVRSTSLRVLVGTNYVGVPIVFVEKVG